MAGTLALVGAGEFLEGMSEVDRHLMERVPGGQARVVILPTAAGLEDTTPWTDMGEAHFGRLGAAVSHAHVIDKLSADDPAHAAMVRAANFVYLSGGSPGHLLKSLEGTLVWDAIQAVYAAGGVLAGCSAGAMVLGGMTRVRRDGAPPGPPSDLTWTWATGLSLLPGIVVAPHFNRQTPERLRSLMESVPGQHVVVGVDEHTAAVSCEASDEWVVMGRGTVSVLHGAETARHLEGQRFSIPHVHVAL